METRNTSKKRSAPQSPQNSREADVKPQKRAKAMSSKQPTTTETEADHGSNNNSKPQKPGTRANESKADSLQNQSLTLEESTGDIFDAPSNTLIIHACNCQGSWSAGIAKAFKDRYPEAFKPHAKLCKDQGQALIGGAQLIGPVEVQSTQNSKKGNTKAEGKSKEARSKHFIGCLFTSVHYGKRKDSPEKILKSSKPAMEDLLDQVKAWNEQAESEKDKIFEVRMCKINSGLFAVPWEKTKALLEEINVSNFDVKTIKVISPDAAVKN